MRPIDGQSDQHINSKPSLDERGTDGHPAKEVSHVGKLISQGGEKILPQLSGRHVLVLEDIVGETRQEYWLAVNAAGVHVHMIYSESHPWLDDHLSSTWVLPQMNDPEPEGICLPIILDRVKERQLPLTACLTFNDKFPLLTSLVNEGLVGCSFLVPPVCYPDGTEQAGPIFDPSEATAVCTSKQAVYDRLGKNPDTVPYLPRSSSIVQSEADVDKFLEETQFPVIMKPNSGRGGYGVRLLSSRDACIAHYHELRRLLDDVTNQDTRCCKDSLICMNEYLRGDYLLVHMALYEGKVATWHVAGNGPHLSHELLPTVRFWPSGMTRSEDEEAAVAAARCCAGAGLRYGVYDVEVIRTRDEDLQFPGEERHKLVEINPRPTCSAIAYRLAECVDANVNLLHVALGVACGIKPQASFDHLIEASGRGSQLNKQKEKGQSCENHHQEGVVIEYIAHPKRHRFTPESKEQLKALCDQREGSASDVYSDKPEFRSFRITIKKDIFADAKREMLGLMEDAHFMETTNGQSIYPCFVFPDDKTIGI